MINPTSFPGFLPFQSPYGGAKGRDPGNEVTIGKANIGKIMAFELSSVTKENKTKNKTKTKKFVSFVALLK